MKKNNSAKRGQQDGSQQPAPPEKVGWVRKYCGKGIFREIWKSRFVVLKGDQLLVCEKEGKDDKGSQELFDLSDYERCEELRKAKSRSKKSHSKFTLARCPQPGTTAPNLLFLAVSPEEKESWVHALSSAIARAKNRVLDEVTVEEESFLAHPTRDRAKIQHSRRPPTRGHLMAVASTSTSDGMLTLDLIQEEETPARDPGSCEGSFRVDLAKSAAQLSAARRRSPARPQPPGHGPAAGHAAGHTGSLPGGQPSPRGRAGRHRDCPEAAGTYTPQVPKRPSRWQRGRCASMEEILGARDCAAPRGEPRTGPGEPRRKKGPGAPPAPAEPEQLSRIQQLLALKLERTQELLSEVRGFGEGRAKPKDRSTASSSSSSCKSDSERLLQESERLLGEASSAWSQAEKVLQEIRELRDLYRQLQPPQPRGKQSAQEHFRRSLM